MDNENISKGSVDAENISVPEEPTALIDIKEALNLDDNIILKRKSKDIFLESNDNKDESLKVAAKSPLTSRFDQVFSSIKNGDYIKTISIPGYHISGDVVFYEVVVTNTRLRWNIWVRFESFTLLHLLIKELASELSDEDVELIPPIPDRHLKILIDHRSQEFVENRRALLENFLQKINKNLTLRYAEDFIHFLLPPHETLPPKGVGTQGNQYSETSNDTEEKVVELLPTPTEEKEALDESCDELKESMVPKFTERKDEMLSLTENDEITGVTIKSAAVLEADQNSGTHVVYHIHVRNVNKDEGFKIWIVIKRFMEFVNFDKKLRESLVISHPADVFCLPHLPPKLIKSWTNHTKAVFIEKRRVLLQVYLRRLIRFPLFRRHSLTLAFLGVQARGASTGSERESLST